MKKIIEKCSTNCLKLMSFVLFSVGVCSINSACNYLFNQPKEPKTLKRFVK